MKSLVLKSLAFLVLGSAFTAGASAATVDQARLKKAMKVLEGTASSGEDAAAMFGSVKVTGKTTTEMLTKYAEKQNYEMSELRVILRMKASDIPGGDDGSNVIGIARNVDVVDLAVDVYRNITDDKQVRALRAKALKALFEVTEAGALVGVESNGWNVCGSTFPALIILDTDKKTVYSLIPENTEC